MQTCPNCGRVVQGNLKICPNCGATVPGGVWPPPVSGQPTPVMPEEKLVTKRIGGDIALGIVLTLVSFFVGIGLIAIPIVYFATTRTYKVFARSMGWAYIALLITLVGAFCACLVLMRNVG